MRQQSAAVLREFNAVSPCCDPFGAADPHRGSGRQISKAGELRLKQQFHGTHRAVAVFGHDHFRDSTVRCFGVVVLVPVDHQHKIGVLFDRS